MQNPSYLFGDSAETPAVDVDCSERELQLALMLLPQLLPPWFARLGTTVGRYYIDDPAAYALSEALFHARYALRNVGKVQELYVAVRPALLGKMAL